MTRYVVFAVGEDRPGIVAAVTGALFDIGANLLDTSMTVLSGHFAIALALEAPVTSGALDAALAGPAGEFDLGITVRAVDPAATPRDAAHHVVSVHGADTPGIVAHVTAALAARRVNIVDVETRRVGDPDDPVYAMLLDVVLPADVVPDELAVELRALGDELGVDTHMHAVDADIL